MSFILRHLCDDLKNKYLQVETVIELWEIIKTKFDHSKTMMFPQARYDWQHLRLQDIRSVLEYNSTLFNVVSRLTLCDETLSNNDLLEKTLSTFHASNLELTH